MSKKPDQPNHDAAGGPPSFSDDDKAKARQWFAKGQELVQRKNYDYAIQSYISGLQFWPEAVDEGHKPCRAAALFRGKQKVSFGDGMKYKMTAKDALQAMLNAEMLLSKDPHNIAYMEAMFKNADRGGYLATLMWIGEIYEDAAVREEKANPARFTLMREVFERVADRIGEADLKTAVDAMGRAVKALERLRALKPTDGQISNELKSTVGKLTILKGRYSSADSFRDSISDTEEQRELHDKERLVQSDERMEELIAAARTRYEANPTEPRAISELVDLLTRRENDADEAKAISILVKAHEDTKDYRFKMRAEDIRMKQLNRQSRRVLATGDKAKARELLHEILKFELGVYRERMKQYPSDMRIRFQYGVRLFKARRYDDAIPVLQEARNDPKTRFQCALYIGRCFFVKKYAAQAVDTFQGALAHYEIPDDELGKDLRYWLGRSYEADGKIEEALKEYGQLIQWDYNFRDVRKRIDDLRSGGKDQAAS